MKKLLSRRILILTITIPILNLYYNNAVGQTSRPDTLVALQVNSPITVDGLLDEQAWSDAQKITNFTQRELHEGEAATEKTQVAVLFQKHSLYIGFWVFDSEPEEIVAQEMRHDFDWESDDNVKVILSPFHDRRNGYLFVVNPNGAYADILIRDEGSGYNSDWNGVWNVNVKRTDEGWFVEMEIPFSTLRFPRVQDHIWGFNVERNISRKSELILWQGWSRDYSLTKISQAGTLTGLQDISGKKHVEIKPFFSGGIEKASDRPLEEKAKIGGDVNVSLSPTMRLNLTLNTDFSQVESDRAQINLSRFSISYPEKREFFLEEKNLFEFNLGENAQTFYTRRIGINNREEVPIIGGARLIGKSKHTNIGLLSIQTAAKDTLPTANYTVVRLKQDILEQSNIGMIIAAKNNRDHYNYVYGIDANYVTSKIFGDKNLKLGGVVTQSVTQKEDNKNNLGYQAFLSYPNDIIEFYLSVTSIQKKYNPEIGYLSRNNYTVYSSELAFNPRPRWLPWISQMEFKPFELSYYVTQDTRKMETVSLEVVPLAFETVSGDQFEFNIYRTYDRLDESFEIMDDIFIPMGDYWYNRFGLQFESFGGRPISVESDVSWGDFYTGSRFELQLEMAWDISRNLKLSADWERNAIDLEGNTFTTHEVGGRIEYEFNPKLYSTLFGQWNNEDKDLLFDFRLNWIPKSGSYFYFIINQKWSSEIGKFVLHNTTVLTKCIWVL